MPNPEQVAETALDWLPAIVVVAFVAKYTVTLVRDIFRSDD
jgi:hypothetical protein